MLLLKKFTLLDEYVSISTLPWIRELLEKPDKRAGYFLWLMNRKQDAHSQKHMHKGLREIN